jgi:hypothetical protein
MKTFMITGMTEQAIRFLWLRRRWSCCWSVCLRAAGGRMWVKTSIGYALFAVILAGSVLTSARQADLPAGAEELTAAVIDLARSNNLTFRGQITLPNHLIDALVFDADDCNEPVTVALLSVLREQVPLLEAQNQGMVLRFIFYDRSWPTADRVSMTWERGKQKALAVLGLTRYVPSEYMLAIGVPSGCKAADSVAWDKIWERRYLASLANDRASREIR